MLSFAYSFCISLLHSFWQAGLLWLVYIAVSKSSATKFTPAQKRNLLFVSLNVQTVLFIFTFCVYYLKPYTAFTVLLNIESLTSTINQQTAGSITKWLFAVYILAVAYKLIKAVYSWWLFKNQFKQSLVKPPVGLKFFTALHQHKFGIKRNVQLWLSQHVSTPLTFGFLKPVIVLPVALINQLSVQQAETLILHELAHIKANDFLLNWFVIAAETVFFFNPFITALCKQLKQEREKNCDITVTAFNYQPLLYAEALLKAQTIKQLAPVALLKDNFRIAAVNKPKHLLNRIQFFINPANQLKPTSKKLLQPAVFLLLAFIAGAGILLQLQTAKHNNKVTAATPLPTVQPAAIKLSDNFPVIVNNVLESLTEEKLKTIVAEVEKQQPVIEAALKKLQPLIEEIEQKAEQLAEDIATNIVTPVAFSENIIEKKIVVREETSGSKNATIKVYTVIYKDGKWLLQPEWKLAAKEILPQDSLKLIDTSNLQLHEQGGDELQD